MRDRDDLSAHRTRSNVRPADAGVALTPHPQTVVEIDQVMDDIVEDVD
ncbi:hypothetical protein ACLBWP_03385 [Microbacterium sp. M1A1_1b]